MLNTLAKSMIWPFLSIMISITVPNWFMISTSVSLTMKYVSL